MSFIKKYWTHFIGIVYLVLINLFLLNFNTIINLFSKNNISIIIIFLIIFAFSVIIWAGMIYFIIHAVKNKDNKNKLADALLIYFFNIYYIPCYYLKSIAKESKLVLKNTIYIITTIALTVALYISMIFVVYNNNLYETGTYENYQYQTILSPDELVKFQIPDFYTQKRVSDYDLYFTNLESVIGVYLYNDRKYTKEELIKYHDDFILDSRKDAIITNTKEYKKDNKTIITHTIRGEKDGTINIYTNNVITFDTYPGYVIYVGEICLESNYDEYNKIHQNIIENMSLNNTGIV